MSCASLRIVTVGASCAASAAGGSSFTTACKNDNPLRIAEKSFDLATTVQSNKLRERGLPVRCAAASCRRPDECGIKSQAAASSTIAGRDDGYLQAGSLRSRAALREEDEILR